MKVFFVLSYIVTESESALICPTATNINFTMEILKKAMNSKNHFEKGSGYWASEVLRAVSLLISCSEQIGKFFISEKYLESALEVLSAGGSFSPSERLYTLRACWSLAFNEETRVSMAKMPILIDGTF